jgi:hypothetical protein
MNKLLAALVATFFATASFAASHAGAPMAGASAPKARRFRPQGRRRFGAEGRSQG